MRTSRVIFFVWALCGVALLHAQTNSARLINISTNGQVGTGANNIVGGFVIRGAPKTVLIRAIGPGLGIFGVSGTLPDPFLTLFDSTSSVIKTNDDWNAADAATMSAVGAFGLSANSKDAVIVATLQPGAYTAQISGLGTVPTGTAILEVYDVSGGGQLINIATRLQVGTGANAATAGFVVSPGGGTRTLLVRGIGPALGAFGLPGALPDPKLVLVDGNQKVLATAIGNGTATDVATASTQAGAFAMTAKDSAVVVAVGPGSYTSQLVGSSGTSSGIGLIEVYDITNSFGLSAVNLNPGQMLTVRGRFDPNLPTTVTFTDSAGTAYKLTPGYVLTNEVGVVAPFLINTNTGANFFGAVTVSVEQQNSTGTVKLGSASNVQIATLPATGVAPGVITAAVLNGVDRLLGSAYSKWSEINRLSKGAVNTTGILAHTASTQAQIKALAAQLRQLQYGQVGQIPTGALGATALNLDLNGLALLDQILLAYFFNGSLPSPAFSLGTRSMARHPVAAESDSIETSIAGAMQGLSAPSPSLPHPNAATVTKLWRGAGWTILGILAYTATIGASVATGTAPLLWAAAALAPAIAGSILEGSAQTTKDPAAGQPTYSETLKLAAEPSTNSFFTAYSGAVATDGNKLDPATTDTASSFKKIQGDLNPSDPTSVASTAALNEPFILSAEVPSPLLSDPVNAHVAVGIPAPFGVVTSGNVTYQWLKDNLPIPGATNSGYTVVSPQLEDSGTTFAVVVTQGGVPFTSYPATLTVVPAELKITAQPIDWTATVGGSASFSVVASGTPPLTYQWFKDNTLIPKATSATLKFDNVQVSQAGKYSVVVEDAHSKVQSSNFATLVVTNPSPTISSVVTSSYDTTAFVKSDGTLWAMGNNEAKQLGDGTTTNRSKPVQVTAGVVSVAAGDDYFMFVKTDGTLWGLGDNAFGELGIGITTDTPQSTPVQVASSVDSVAAGGFTTMFIKKDGTLWAVGFNGSGQLGDGTTTDRNIPIQVASGVASVSEGGAHTMFVKKDGTLWTMGFNDYGQLGDGTTTNRSSPIEVASGVASVAAGERQTVFVKIDHTLWVMGNNGAGQLGNGVQTELPLSAPTQVASGVASAVTLTSETAFVKTDGTLWVAGNSLLAKTLPTPTSVLPFPPPAQLASGVASVAVGWNYTLFVKTDGTLWAVGSNSNGQLGDGTRTDRSTPVQVAGPGTPP